MTEKTYRDSTKAIVAAAQSFVKQKESEGWKQADFAAGLAKILGIRGRCECGELLVVVDDKLSYCKRCDK